MSEQQFGEIPIDDYLHIIDHKKRPSRGRFVRSAAVLLMCTLCLAAGNYLRPWSGDNPLDLTFEQALDVIEHGAPPAHSRSAAEMLRRYCKRSINALGDLKHRKDGQEPFADAILAWIVKHAQQAR